MHVAGKWLKAACVSKVSDLGFGFGCGSAGGLFWKDRATYGFLQPCVSAVISKLPGCLRTRAAGSLHASTPKATMKILDIPQTGTLGTVVSVRTRYGQVRRPYVSPKNRRTPAQVRIRSNFGHVLALWGRLTDEQRTVWGRAAEGYESRPRLGQSGRLSGYLLFVKINWTLAYYGQAAVDTPTERPIFEPNVVDGLVITNAAGVIELKLRVALVPAAQMVVLGTRPRGPGVSFAKHFAILGLLPAPQDGYSNITELFVARYGLIPVGRRIFIRTRQHLNGWEDLPKQTTAIVPGA
jgi:hypothetical protein